MKTEDFYKQQFPKDWELIKSVRNNPFFTLDSMLQFAELYHENEVNKLAMSDVRIAKRKVCSYPQTEIDKCVTIDKCLKCPFFVEQT